MRTPSILALAFGGWGSTSAVYGLWDLARQNLGCVAGASCGYPLPFAHYVPWYIAGDAFVTMAFVGMAAFILGAVGLLRGAGSSKRYPELPPGIVARILQSSIDELLVPNGMPSFPASSGLGLAGAAETRQTWANASPAILTNGATQDIS